jgi:hypothetical protein
MCVCPVDSNYRSVARKHQALVDIKAPSLLQQRIDWCAADGDASNGPHASSASSRVRIEDPFIKASSTARDRFDGA